MPALRPPWTALLLLAVAVAPRPVLADDATEAKLRFDRGLAHVEEGKVREALDEFFVSNRLSPNPSTAFNIAACLEALGHHDQAFSAYSEFLSHEVTEEEKGAAQEALDRVLPQVARLTVRSTPPGAAIFLDRRNLGQYGVTPRTLAATAGKHTVILTLPGYHPVRQETKLIQGREAQVDVELRALAGRLRVASQPPGAVVRLGGPDGQPRGQTPLELELPLGSVRVAVALAGHEPREETAQVTTRAPAEVSLRLEPLPPPEGHLRVVSNVASALVTVDGREAGFTPLVHELPQGRHELLVRKPDYQPWAGALTIDPTRATALEVTLRPVPSEEEHSEALQWVLLSTSAAAGLLGAGLGWWAASAAEDFEQRPTRDGFDTVGRLNVAADILFGVAVLGGVATLTSILVRQPEEAGRSSVRVSHRRVLQAPQGAQPGGPP